MRKISYLLLAICCIIVFACKKEKTKTEETYLPKVEKARAEKIYFPKNEPITIQGKNGITVTASDVYSKFSEFKRKIEISNPSGKGKFSEIFLSFKSDHNKNVYDEFKEDRNSVSGLFEIETGGQVIYKKRIINGKIKKGESIGYKVPGPVYDPNVACTVSTVHNCVSWEIEDMNWIEYGACLISAPGCYATLWASCTWEVCHNHMRYTNPIQ
jgi:hypothetical protein